MSVRDKIGRESVAHMAQADDSDTSDDERGRFISFHGGFGGFGRGIACGWHGTNSLALDQSVVNAFVIQYGA